MSRINFTTHRGDRAASPFVADTPNVPLHESLIPHLDRQLRSGMKPSRVELASGLPEHGPERAGHERRGHGRGGPGHGAHGAHRGHEAHRWGRPHGADDAPMAHREPRAPGRADRGQPLGSPVRPAPAPTNSLAPQPAPAPARSTAAQPAQAAQPAPARAPAPQPAPAVRAAASPGTPSPAPRPANVRSVEEAAASVVPKFMPVLRGDEAAKDAAILTQADFARAVDQTALDYGLNPQVFRAQLQVESGALTNDFRLAMKHEGDLDRAAENNTSIGIGQISRRFLDGREWSGGGPGNPRVGSQVVTTEQYMNSPTVQLRMAASNIAQRIADNGGLVRGLTYYVSGNAEPNANGQSYIAKINERLKDPAVVGV